jgi:hypothetical protein
MVNFGEASTYFGVVETNYIEKKEATRLYQEALNLRRVWRTSTNGSTIGNREWTWHREREWRATLSPSDWFNDLMNALVGISVGATMMISEITSPDEDGHFLFLGISECVPQRSIRIATYTQDEINLKVVCNNWRRPDLKAGAYVEAQGVLIVEDDIPTIMADRIRL